MEGEWRWRELGYHFYLLLVSVDVDEVEGEDVVLSPHQQPPPLLVQQEGVVAGAVGHAVEGDQVTRVQHFWEEMGTKGGAEGQSGQVMKTPTGRRKI